MLTLMGMGPRRSAVRVTHGEIDVRMGRAFRAVVPAAAIVKAEPAAYPAGWGWGVHGWRGKWLVNGSSEGIVALTIEPPARATMCGIRVSLRVLLVSLDDPNGFLAALNRARNAG